MGNEEIAEKIYKKFSGENIKRIIEAVKTIFAKEHTRLMPCALLLRQKGRCQWQVI